MQEWRGKAWSTLSREWRQSYPVGIQSTEGGGGGPLIERPHFVLVFLARSTRKWVWPVRQILCTRSLFWTRSSTLFALWMFKTTVLQCLVQTLKEKTSSLFFQLGTSPHPVYQGTDVIKWTMPSPLFLHTASDQKLDSGKAWEWGYSETTTKLAYYLSILGLGSGWRSWKVYWLQ